MERCCSERLASHDNTESGASIKTPPPHVPVPLKLPGSVDYDQLLPEMQAAVRTQCSDSERCMLAMTCHRERVVSPDYNQGLLYYLCVDETEHERLKQRLSLEMTQRSALTPGELIPRTLIHHPVAILHLAILKEYTTLFFWLRFAINSPLFPDHECVQCVNAVILNRNRTFGVYLKSAFQHKALLFSANIFFPHGTHNVNWVSFCLDIVAEGYWDYSALMNDLVDDISRLGAPPRFIREKDTATATPRKSIRRIPLNQF